LAPDDVADQLYGLPLEEFTRARNEAAAELRKAGRRDEADAVKALRKPTAAAATLNRLVRDRRREVEAFLAAAAELRDAQFGGKGDLGAATKRERDALTKLVRAGGAKVRQSLEAAAVDDEAAEQLLGGRLTQELEPRGFGTLLAHGVKLSPPRPKGKSRPQKADDRAERERLREAKEELAAAQAAERQARRHHQQTLKDVERAERSVAEAERALAKKR
jgi:hypothetical protein